MKKLLAILLSVFLLAATIPLSVPVYATSYTSDDAISWLWSKEGQAIDYDGYYGAQCADLAMAYYKYLIGWNVGGNGCDYATNTLPSGWVRTKGGQPQKGDILVYAGGTGAGHVAICESDYVTWHQNWGGQYVRRITNRHYTDFKAYDGATYWGCIHPNFSGVNPHVINTSYGKNFTAYPKAKITAENIFDANHNKISSSAWIGTSDLCTILEVYTDGCCKVTYPLDAGGSRTAYSKISLFNCNHSYNNATCTKAKTCKYCGATSGSALGHKYDNACDSSCNTCGATRSTTHDYAAATCTAPKTCKVCGATSGSALGHKYDNTCDSSCNTCGTTRSVTHDYAAATCTKPKTCQLCGATSGSALGHKYEEGETEAPDCQFDGYVVYNCTVCYHYYVVTIPSTGEHVYDNACDSSCNTCGVTRSTTHDYAAATCTAPKTCKVCGATSGSALGHTYDDDYDAYCNVCGKERGVPEKPPVTPDLPADAPAFVVESVTACEGEEITVAIRTQRNSGIVSLRLEVAYDADVLELISLEEGDFANVVLSPTTRNPFIANWTDAINPNNTTDGVVVLATFRVKEGAPLGKTEITLTYDPEDVYDQNFDNVGFRVENGYVEVVDYVVGDVNEDGRINNKDLGILQQYLAGFDVSVNQRASDVTADGRVNNKDLGILQQYLAGFDVTLG